MAALQGTDKDEAPMRGVNRNLRLGGTAEAGALPGCSSF